MFKHFILSVCVCAITLLAQDAPLPRPELWADAVPGVKPEALQALSLAWAMDAAQTLTISGDVAANAVTINAVTNGALPDASFALVVGSGTDIEVMMVTAFERAPSQSASKDGPAPAPNPMHRLSVTRAHGGTTARQWTSGTVAHTTRYPSLAAMMRELVAEVIRTKAAPFMPSVAAANQARAEAEAKAKAAVAEAAK